MSSMATRTAQGTKERILDVALDLFVEQSYEATSLREIAERVEVSKAALYYHFPSKADILLGLHMRMHEIFADVLPEDGVHPTVDGWLAALKLIGRVMLSNKKLMALSIRNHQAFDEVERAGGLAAHDEAQERLEATLRGYLTDAALPLEVRVRVTAGLAVVLSMAFVQVAGFELGGEVSDGQLDSLLLDGLLDRILGDILDPVRETP